VTLDDLLALLPDNTSGDIAAADMRTIVTELWNQGAGVQAAGQAAYVSLDDRVAALEGGTATPTYQASGRWQVNPQPGTPGGMQVSADQASWAAASVLRFAVVDQHNNDVRNVLTLAVDVFGQSQADDANWSRWEVTGTPTDHGAYVEIPVAFVNGAGSIAAAGWQAGVFVFTVAVP
jgi:hypothetical protein